VLNRAEVHLDAPADVHAAVARRADVESLGGQAAAGVEVLERAVLARRLYVRTPYASTP